MSDSVVPRHVIPSNGSDFVALSHRHVVQRVARRRARTQDIRPDAANADRAAIRRRSRHALVIEALSWPVISITQFWRSFEDLERSPHADTHPGSWKWFNKLGRNNEGTGIWHETYRISAGT